MDFLRIGIGPEYETVDGEIDHSFIQPGCGLVPGKQSRLWAIVGSGIVLTLFDKRLRYGGMTHFSRPYRERNKPSTAYFAAPATLWLLRQFANLGSRKEDLETQLVGGASDHSQPGYIPSIHDQNTQVALEILQKEGIWVNTMDVGGTRGRKIMFNTGNGESAIARIGTIEESAWYPQMLECEG